MHSLVRTSSYVFDRIFRYSHVLIIITQSTIQSIIQRDLPDIARDHKRTALQIARSLQNQLFFYEVEWGDRQLSGGVEDVFMFLDEPNDGNGVGLGGITERDELPTGVITSLTRCYTVDCVDNKGPCYSYSCPKRNVRRQGWIQSIYKTNQCLSSNL